MPRLRARIAAWLVPPPVSVTIPAIGRLPRLMAWLGQDLVGHQDDRLARRRFGSWPSEGATAGGLDGQVRADPRDDVAEVGHPLAEIVLLDPGEAGGVPLEDDLDAPRAPSGAATRSGARTLASIASSLTIWRWRLEDVGLGRAELLGDLLDDRLQLGRRGRRRRARTARPRPGRAPGRPSVCGSADPKTESTR